MKIINGAELNNLFNDNKIDILLNYMHGIAKYRHINAFFTLLRYAIVKNNTTILNEILTIKHMRFGKCSNINIFKEAVASGSLELCQRMVATKMVTLKYHHNILEYALSYKSIPSERKKLAVKIEKIKWILTFPAIRKELKNSNIYKGILLRDYKQLFVPIILPLIENKTWFNKLIPTILSCIGRYNTVELLDFLINHNHIKMNNIELIQTIYSSIIPEDTKVLDYCFSNYPQTKEIVQNILENFKLENIHWNKYKYENLKHHNIDLFKTSKTYCSLVNLWLLHYQDQSNHHYRLLDLLDNVKEDLLQYPEVVKDIIENNKSVLKEHRKDFLKLLSYYNLQEKIPNKETIAKRKKI